MARVAGITDDAWNTWSAASSTDEEAAPVTSRSPSFVRIRSSEGVTTDVGDEDWIVAEPSVHDRRDTVRPPVVVEEFIPVRPAFSWGDYDLDLRLAALRLEEAVQGVADEARATRVRGLLAELASLVEHLRSMTEARSDQDPLLLHVYEWATNVAARAADEATVASLHADDGELVVTEYSSLFVRKIIDPMLESALEVATENYAAALCELRERIVWVNWSVRGVEA